jgi:class 3 adenylate cyclase/CheY-like chemotaxis protein
MLRVLLVQTQDQSAQFLARFFKERGDVVASTVDLGKAATFISEFKPDLMMLDLHFQGNEWITFLRIVRLEYPDLKIIITNKYPDLQREMRAREQGVKVFVRYPFTQYWLNRGLKSLNLPATMDHRPDRVDYSRALPAFRIPVRVKITLPYLILTLVVALGSAYMVSRMIMQTARQRFYSQLADSRIQASNWMVRREDGLLNSLRLIANTQGVAGTIERSDSEGLRKLVLPLLVNSNDEVVQILDLNGASVFSALRKPGSQTGEYQFSRGDDSLGRTPFVRSLLEGKSDKEGDKFSGLVTNPGESYFYVGGPVFSSAGKQVGVLLIGNTLEELSQNMQSEILSQVTFYDSDGEPLASTLFTGKESFPVGRLQVSQVMTDPSANSLMRSLGVNGDNYLELLGAWEVRGGQKVGVLGVALPQTFLTSASRVVPWEIFVVVAVGILLVIGVGVFLASVITSPIQRLVAASNQVSQGNLDVKVDVKGADEVSALAQSFNQMVTGLQEGVIYRDILGHAVSPDMRDQLREAFSSGSVKLEGQEAVGTILFSDIRGFTSLAEQVEPTRVFDWLNEYFSQLTPMVNNFGGVVNQFDGDSMLAFFGILPAVLMPQESAVAACRAGLEIIKAVDELNSRRSRRGEPPLITGIGINTGVMIAGGLGTSDRLHYTIIGETVNTTQRLESMTRELYPGNGVLISHATYTALGSYVSEFKVEALGRRFVKGGIDRLLVYRLLPLKAETEVRVML